MKVTEACFRLSKPGTLALDIGANVGQMTSALVHAMETGRVRAFEPHPEIFPVLEENVSRLRSEVPGVTIEASKMAVAQESGSRTLYIPDRWSHNHGVATLREMKGADRVRVKVCTLDREVTSEIHLMKVDVEEKFEGLIKGGYKKIREGRVSHIVF
nr:FkbM family methyltransferase [Salinibacter ruber]